MTSDIDTPALLIDRTVLRSNIARMQSIADGFGVALRPHIKTHKSPEIARMQVSAGANGITVAKLGEAEVMADAGLEDILIANQIVGVHKMPRLAELARRVRLGLLIDSRKGVEILESAFAAAAVGIDVLIEVDTGKQRCGLQAIEDLADVAAAITDAEHLRLRGIETHEGHVAAGAESSRMIESRALDAGRRIVQLAGELRARGYQVDEISVGSTPGAPYTARIDGITEMRPGTYIFNDVNQMCIGQATPDTCALSVLATVISRPTADRAVLDAGSKALFSEPARNNFALQGYDGYGFIREAPAAQISSLSEEHAVVLVPDGVAFPAIGEQVRIIPNHVCPCVNLHDELLLLDGAAVAEMLPIAARGKIK